MGSLIPSGSVGEPVRVPWWAAPVEWPAAPIAVGSLVEVAPHAGALWGGEVCVVVGRRTGSRGVGTYCRIVGRKGTVELPEGVLRIVTRP